MTPLIRKLRERKEKPAAAGIAMEVRPSDYSEPVEDESVLAVEPFAVQILIAIAANDHKALSEALVNAHDAMHAVWDNDNQANPHTYESQKE